MKYLKNLKISLQIQKLLFFDSIFSSLFFSFSNNLILKFFYLWILISLKKKNLKQ